MTDQDSTPKIHIDADWKAEAQAEKERMKASEAAHSGESREQKPRGPRELPEANFRTLVSVLASQALLGLGTVADPEQKGVMVDLDGARFSIDLLGVLEDKTTGNLSDDESKELKSLLGELRSRFVQVSQLIAQQAKIGAGQPPGASTPGGPQPPFPS
jgi:uncharacterized membrane protein